ncbi:hypothetical protein BpHYR1_014038, partial [Brachionus plicatilis]
GSIGDNLTVKLNSKTKIVCEVISTEVEFVDPTTPILDNMVCYNIDANYDYFDYQNHDVLDSEDSEKKIFRYDNKRKKKYTNRVVYKDILKA